jgi:hypothetical protein
MADERRSVPYRRVYSTFGKTEGIGFAPHPVDRSKSFTEENSGELTPAQYRAYDDRKKLLARNGISTKEFPPTNPTLRQFSGLLMLVTNHGLDLD